MRDLCLNQDITAGRSRGQVRWEGCRKNCNTLLLDVEGCVECGRGGERGVVPWGGMMAVEDRTRGVRVWTSWVGNRQSFPWFTWQFIAIWS